MAGSCCPGISATHLLKQRSPALLTPGTHEAATESDGRGCNGLLGSPRLPPRNWWQGISPGQENMGVCFTPMACKHPITWTAPCSPGSWLSWGTAGGALTTFCRGHFQPAPTPLSLGWTNAVTPLPHTDPTRTRAYEHAQGEPVSLSLLCYPRRQRLASTFLAGAETRGAAKCHCHQELNQSSPPKAAAARFSSPGSKPTCATRPRQGSLLCGLAGSSEAWLRWMQSPLALCPGPKGYSIPQKPVAHTSLQQLENPILPGRTEVSGTKEHFYLRSQFPVPLEVKQLPHYSRTQNSLLVEFTSALLQLYNNIHVIKTSAKEAKKNSFVFRGSAVVKMMSSESAKLISCGYILQEIQEARLSHKPK